jgi:hypothetical protein
VAGVGGQDRKARTLCRGDDRHVGESGCLARAAREVAKGTGDPGGRHVERQDALAIQMQKRIEPSREIIRPAAGALPADLAIPASISAIETADM